MERARLYPGANVSAFLMLITFTGTTFAEAACIISPAGMVNCSQITTTNFTTDTNGATSTSSSRTQLFENGSPIAAEIAPGVTINGAGFALGELGRARTIALSDDGAVIANASTQGAVVLSGNGGAVTYRGAGSVANITGPALFARNTGDITLIVDGTVTGGAPGMPVNGLTPTPAGIAADATGGGNVIVGGAGDVTAPGGRGLIAEEEKTGRGSVLVAGTGNVAGQGRICPGVDFNLGLNVGKVGCSGIRAIIDNRADGSDVTVNRSGNVMGTSTAINAITLGRGNVAVTTGQTARIVGAFEFGIEAMGQGTRSTGSIAVTTGAGGTLSSGGDGIFAANLADQIPVGARSTIVVHAAGQIMSGTFPLAARNDKNPTGVLAGISAGYVGGGSPQSNAAVNGSVFIENAALITAQTGNGILGYNFGAGSIHVMTSASITALAGDGISTQSTTGPTSIVVRGAGTIVQGSGFGHAAMTGRSTGGEIDVQIGGGATLRGIDGAAGFDMEGTRSLKTISNSGTIIGGLSRNGDPAMSSTDGVGVVGANLTILNNGEIIGGGTNGGGTNQAYAVLLTGGVNSIGGAGTIVGGINVTGTSSFMPALTGSVVGTPLAVVGPLRFVSTATYQIRLTPSASDSAAVSGTATLHGASVIVNAIGTAPVQGTRYTILTAAGGVSSPFSGVTSNLAFFRPALAYGTTDVVLTSRYNYLLTGGTQNQMAVGTALNAAAAQARPGTSSAIFDALQNVSAIQGAAALDSISGEGITAAQTVAERSSRLFISAIFDQTMFHGSNAGNDITLTDAPPALTAHRPIHELADLPSDSLPPIAAAIEPNRTWHAWGSGFGSFEDTRGSSVIGSAAQSSDIYGGVLGVDYQPTPNYLAGIAVGASDGEFSVPDRLTAGSASGGHVAFYDVATLGKSYGATSTSFSYFSNRTTRVTGGFGGLDSETDRGNFGSHVVSSRLEFGRHFDGYGGTITPFIAMELVELRANGFSESAVSGPGLLALNVRGQSSASVQPSSERGSSG